MGEQKLPEGFMKKMQELLGGEWEAFLAGYEQEEARGLRLNLLKGKPEDMEKKCRDKFHLEAVPWAEGGFFYGGGDRPGKHPFHEAGLYYIQEPSAMAAAGFLGVKPGEFILDLCAAPGGKSTQIAGLLKGQGLLVSNEIHPARAKILSQNIERMGIRNAAVTNQDSLFLAGRFPEFFDKILVDAPCSGEGMFRRDEEARRQWSLSSAALCQARQLEILGHGARMLKPGGCLVYSTCTFAPEENEGSVRLFLERHPEFSIQKGPWHEGFGSGRPQWGLKPGQEENEELANTCRLWPHKIRGEGHFIARLVKNKGDRENAIQVKTTEEEKKRKSGKTDREKLDPARREGWERFCRETFPAYREGGTGFLPWEDMPGRYLLFGEQFYYVHQALGSLDGMKVLRPGLHLGTFKKNRFEPSHALALFLKPDQVFWVKDLPGEADEVFRYLKGEALPSQTGKNGWALVCVDGFSLGWAKEGGGLLKNHYPKGLRWR